MGDVRAQQGLLHAGPTRARGLGGRDEVHGRARGRRVALLAVVVPIQPFVHPLVHALQPKPRQAHAAAQL